ncbi:MAG TPA: sugar transferase [Azospirillaceae bacterium]|nr:sugar transferase [Azospirillaceae bacterium]
MTLPATKQAPARRDGDAAVPQRPSYETAKRILDVGLTLVLLIPGLPVMLVIAILVRATSPGPVLFRQTRIGRHERPFTMLKFRTMRVGGDDAAHREYNTRELQGCRPAQAFDGTFKVDDPRTTRVGRVLRRYSLDELPQLLNVLRGEMSLVGPRPSLPWEVELYTLEQRRRHDCLPGMTGLWQVSGRNRIPMPEMLALDVAYARSRSLALDLWILVRTPYAVVFGSDTR